MDNKEFIAINYDVDNVYLQDIRDTTIKGKVIIYLYNEIENLKQELEYAREWTPNEFKNLDGTIKDPDDFTAV